MLIELWTNKKLVKSVQPDNGLQEITIGRSAQATVSFPHCIYLSRIQCTLLRSEENGWTLTDGTTNRPSRTGIRLQNGTKITEPVQLTPGMKVVVFDYQNDQILLTVLSGKKSCPLTIKAELLTVTPEISDTTKPLNQPAIERRNPSTQGVAELVAMVQVLTDLVLASEGEAELAQTQLVQTVSDLAAQVHKHNDAIALIAANLKIKEQKDSVQDKLLRKILTVLSVLTVGLGGWTLSQPNPDPLLKTVVNAASVLLGGTTLLSAGEKLLPSASGGSRKNNENDDDDDAP